MQSVTLQFQRGIHQQGLSLNILKDSVAVFSGTLRGAADWLRANGFTYLVGTNGQWVRHGHP